MEGTQLITIKQASELWCPLKKLEPEGLDFFREQNIGCIGNKCAMWRWEKKNPLPEPRDAQCWYAHDDVVAAVEEPPRVDYKGRPVPDHAVWVPLRGEGDDTEGGGWEESKEYVDAENRRAVELALDDARGYCGLAGRPV